MTRGEMREVERAVPPNAEVAIFGGSFDPPHLAHVLVSVWARVGAGVDHVLWIPTFEHAFGKRLLPFEKRAEMCRLAIEDLPFASVSRIERERGGTSRTLDTLEGLRAEHPDWRMRLLIGSDLLATTSRWYRWDEVAALAPPLVVGRPGHLGEFREEARELTMPDVSSTAVRAAIAAEESVMHLLPAAVAAYIEERGLYRQAEVGP